MSIIYILNCLVGNKNLAHASLPNDDTTSVAAMTFMFLIHS